MSQEKQQEFKDKLEALLREYPNMRLNVKHEVEVVEMAEVAVEEPKKTE